MVWKYKDWCTNKTVHDTSPSDEQMCDCDWPVSRTRSFRFEGKSLDSVFVSCSCQKFKPQPSDTQLCLKSMVKTNPYFYTEAKNCPREGRKKKIPGQFLVITRQFSHSYVICSSHYYVIVFSSYCNCFSCCIVWLDFQSWIFTSGEKGRAQVERLRMHSDEADSCERPAPPNWLATKSHFYDDEWMPWIWWFECGSIIELFEFNFCSFIKNYYFVILQIGNAALMQLLTSSSMQSLRLPVLPDGSIPRQSITICTPCGKKKIIR